MRRRLAALLKEEDGQALVITAVSLLVLLAFVGLVVDVGQVLYAHHRVQIAAEAAALAAGLEVSACGGSPGCAVMQTAAQSALAENGLLNSTVSTNCATMTASAAPQVMLNNPPCFRGSADPNYGNPLYVEAVVSQRLPTPFASFAGIHGLTVTGRAEAHAVNPNCVYALDPSGWNAISVDALATLSANCGVVDESSSSGAFSCALLAAIHVPNLKITGGLQSFLCSTSPQPRTGVPVPTPADPLAYLPAPALLPCGASVSTPYAGSAVPLLISGTAVLYPNAAYCGGITILPGAQVTFMPGTYVLRSGGFLNMQGGLSVSLGAAVMGNGVTFYNFGPAGGISFVGASVLTAGITLLAPSTGSYAGVLFFQPSVNASPAVLVGSSSWNTELEGAFYFPNAQVTCAVSGLSRYNILVARDIHFAVLTFATGTLSATTFGSNYTSLANGSPLTPSASVVVQ